MPVCWGKTGRFQVGAALGIGQTGRLAAGSYDARHEAGGGRRGAACGTGATRSRAGWEDRGAMERMSVVGRLWAELRRRHVLKAGGVYAVAAFAVLQLGEIVLPAFGTPAWALQSLVICAFAGLPVVLGFAWVYDLAPGTGLRRTRSLGGEGAGTMAPRLALLAVTAGSATLAAFWLGRKLSLPQAPDPSTREEASRESPRNGPAAGVSFAGLDPAAPVTAIAVLPLADLAAGDDFFARQLHDEIINELTRATTLRVVPRASAERYADTGKTLPEVARDLRVQAVVTGSVAMTAESDSVRISVQLLHAASDTHLMTKTFQREMKDVLRLQTEIAGEIASVVRGEVDRTAGPRADGPLAGVREVHPAALEAYFRGRDALRRTEPRVPEALDYFARAVAADSSFAGAWAGVAEAGLMAMLDAGPGAARDEDMAGRVRLSLRRAEELGGYEEDVAAIRVVLDDVEEPAPDAPGSADGRGTGIRMYVRDFTWIGQQAARALARRDSGGFEPEAAGVRAARRFAARRLAGAGQYDSAAALYREMVQQDGADMAAWRGLEEAYLLSEDYGRAAATRAEALLGGHAGGVGRDERGREFRAASEAGDSASYWRARDRDNQIRTAHGEHVFNVERAAAALGLGDEDRALEYLEAAVAAAEPRLGNLRGHPMWDPLRDDPRFKNLAEDARRLWSTLGRPGRPPRTPPPN